MRSFIYKSLIVAIILVIAFEFTIGKRIDPLVKNIDRFSDEQGRKELINKLRKEMNKADAKYKVVKNNLTKIYYELSSQAGLSKLLSSKYFIKYFLSFM